LLIDPNTWVIEQRDIESERRAGIGSSIGSTTTGTGAALVRRIERKDGGTFAKDVAELHPYIAHTSEVLTDALQSKHRVKDLVCRSFIPALIHIALAETRRLLRSSPNLD
jgi:adenylosuccinate synthase